MDIRSYHIQSYIWDQKIHQLIGHSTWTFARILLQPLLLVFLLFGTWYIIPASFQYYWIKWLWWFFAVCAYIYGIYKFIDHYLDALVVTSSGLMMYQWNGIWNRKLTNLQRISIESIDEEKNGFIDMMLDEGNITISVEDKVHVFNNVEHSSQIVQDLLDWKREFTFHHNSFESENTVISTDWWDKFDILVETLSEVIQDYMERKPKSNDIY